MNNSKHISLYPALQLGLFTFCLLAMSTSTYAEKADQADQYKPVINHFKHHFQMVSKMKKKMSKRAVRFVHVTACTHAQDTSKEKDICKGLNKK